MAYPDIPQPEYEYNEARLIREYQKAYIAILKEITQLVDVEGEDNAVYQKQASALRQIEVILANLDAANKAWCEAAIAQAFVHGQQAALLSAGIATSLVEAAAGVSFSMIAKNTVDAVIADTYKDLLKATENTGKAVKQIVRSTVADIMRQRLAQRYGRVTISKEINKELTKKFLAEKVKKQGFVGIIDKAGRKWDTKRYAEMVTRTKLNQAHVEGVRVEGKERGIDTAVISTHNAADACFDFEGMIISLNGETPGLLTYSELYASNLIFHPNCRHKVHLCKLQLLPKAVLDKHRQKVKSLNHGTMKTKIDSISKIKDRQKQVV
ncbi:phage minor capsid protein [Bacillus wiedmannii]|uniref:phage minor capsid protein n=1 Tax=Bacillus wiedmannii TaxID=1890302 RepID=UPI000BEF2F75|nr:phage minor capsid protein [Bacillus wiedmannii]PEM08498.1 minor capsid protein [Bacillus wiedmannii]